MAKFELDVKKSKKLEEELRKTKGALEKPINDFLHLKGAIKVTQSIIGFMPKSDRKKNHAKDSNSLTTTKINLGFEVKSKLEFGYLVFPDQGRGIHNPTAQEFFARGLEKESDILFNSILKIVEENTKLNV